MGRGRIELIISACMALTVLACDDGPLNLENRLVCSSSLGCDADPNTLGPAGGQVSFHDDAVTITVPAGALTEYVEFGAEPASAWSPDPLVNTGTPLDFTPHNLTFAEPVKLELHYASEDLADHVLENELRLYRLSDGEWLQVAGSVVDTAADIVMASLSSFSTLYPRGVDVAAVSVAPADTSVVEGQAFEMRAVTLDASNDTLLARPVLWSSSNIFVAAVQAGGNGLATGPGTATFTAMSEGVRGTAQVTVTAADVETVQVEPRSLTLTIGATRQLSASALDGDGNQLSRSFEWDSSDPEIATVSTAGLVRGIGVGTTDIAALTDNQFGLATVTVREARVEYVQITPTNATTHVGGTVQLNATALDAAHDPLAGRTITWASQNEAVAAVTGGGLVAGIGVGTTLITATSEGVSDTASITVGPAPVASVEVSPASSAINALETVQLAATLRDAAGNVLTGRTVEWSSDDDLVASVDANGLVTGTGVDGGTATITALSEGQSGTATVVVEPAPVATVDVSPSIDTVVVNESLLLTATARDAVGNSLSGRNIAWSTSDPAVATVAANTSFTAVTTGVGAGTASIAATAEGQSGSAIITVDTVETGPSNLVLSYGFEDWTGSAETTPGYIFRIDDAGAWDRQLAASDVVSSCGGRTAHSGTYFWRRRMDQNYDPCLGTTPISENSYIRFGNGDATYPVNSGDTTDLRTAITGEVLTFRFWFRLTGNWPPTGISMNWSKFIRPCFGNADYEHDDACGHIMLHQNATRFAIWDAPTAVWYYQDVDDLDDGQWHSLSIVHTRLNQTLTSPNYNITYWLDDWDMEGSPTQDVDMFIPDAGTNPFRMIALFVNYGGSSNPTNEHAIEFDDFEIWDGLPN